ncbi:bifunctional folylpolyglutamate synthase/dihydrofolate synthase [Sphingomonas sinipercae]|uniref:tetrahydrofolate synthase n=1 Tax=Sphingomonas sinipercae TaxID=2714944 RepID=A0A6G7ZMY9_9SPHN|nr:folylpolyglutamate synthase/dihydrofolate synthase family protein [Sphingomonas sinipercae]QIL02303.1 bifunctional folylpolyglutamate synthase/dihydrofolate synthase [Sphingomonas sinipercae]
MADFARSDSAAVQAQLDRLSMLSPGGDQLGLDRISRLLDRLGRPQDSLPPVFHVAGTNGKGSTCAFLRAGLEAAGQRVHAFTSPHLVRFNERIRVAGKLIEDDALAALLTQVLDVGADIQPSFFEVATAVAFLAFAQFPADACIVEVGLGGRLDATNVLELPAVCGIAALGVDHEQFLGADPAGIAYEKASIAKPGVPLVVGDYAQDIFATVARVAQQQGAPLFAANRDWHFAVEDGKLDYRDSEGALQLPLPHLAGAHQAENCALALAMLRHQRSVDVPVVALQRMPVAARWPARLQRLQAGPLTALTGRPIWVDGGHNPDAAERVGDWLSHLDGPRPLLVVGILANKDASGILKPLAASGSPLVAVPVPDHACHDPGQLAALARELGFPDATAAPDAMTALSAARGSPVAILGSLYLAGAILRANGEMPD